MITRLGLLAAATLALSACSSDGAKTPVASASSAPMGCASLTGVKVPNGSVTAANMVQPGAALAGGRGPVASAAYCRVQVTLKPSAISNIKVELWLPDAGRWNGKFLGTGNGGAAGTISTPALVGGVNRGYAVANTDMGSGSSGLNFAFAIGKLDLVKDFGMRSTEGMTKVGRQLTSVYYGHQPAHSYFQGCSTGGHQAWEAVQTLYADYDGVVAGAPANDRTHLHMVGIYNAMVNRMTPGGGIPKAKMAMIQKAAVAACDGIDGVKDGIIDDPRLCRFDPASIQCKAADGPECLTAGQVATLKTIYRGMRNPRTGAQIYSGFEPGSEGGVNLYWDSPVAPDGQPVVNDGMMNWSDQFQKAHPTGAGFDFDKDVQRVDGDIGKYLNFVNPDLSNFSRRGGKVIIYHGWADTLVPSGTSPWFYEKVQKANGGPAKTAQFARLFMAPGMGHCRGGSGPDQFDALTALEAWVEKGEAPQSIIASKPARNGQPAMSRPLCPYPQVARRTGQGDPNQASSFACVAPAAS